MTYLLVTSVSLFLSFIPSSLSISHVCEKDGLGVCDAFGDVFNMAKICSLSVKIGDATPKCGDDVAEDKWPQKDPPEITVSGDGCCHGNGKFGLLMTDPDAPNCKIEGAKYWLHFLALGLDCEESKVLDLSGGQTLKSYRPPTPPAPNDPSTMPAYHRYQFFFFAYSEPKKGMSGDLVKKIMAETDDRSKLIKRFSLLFKGFQIRGVTEFHTKQDRRRLDVV